MRRVFVGTFVEFEGEQTVFVVINVFTGVPRLGDFGSAGLKAAKAAGLEAFM